jgi:hypothetical protein
VQATVTGWGNTVHSSDGILLATNNLSGSNKNVYHLHDITTHSTHMIPISQTHNVSTTNYFVFPEMFLLFPPLLDDTPNSARDEEEILARLALQ